MKNKHLIYIICLGVILIFSLIWSFDFFKDNSFKKILDKEEFVVGIDFPYGVMSFIGESGEFQGIDVDIANELANEMGVDLKIVWIPWEEIFLNLENGKIDAIVNSLTITEERKNSLLFSQPYFDTGQAIVIRKNDFSIDNSKDLNKKIIGVQVDTTGAIVARDLVDSELFIREYSSYDVELGDSIIFVDLLDEKIDAVIVDYIFGQGIVKNNPDLKLLENLFKEEQYGIAVKLGNKSLIKKINNILDKMEKEGKLEEIKNKWLEN